VLAWSRGGTLRTPLHAVALPRLAGRLDGGAPAEDDVLAAFGELAPLLDECWSRAGWRRAFDPGVLWPVLAHYLSTPTVVVCLPASRMDAGRPPDRFWCSAEPERALAEVRAVVSALHEACTLLAPAAAAGAPAAGAA
jgi:hypothetical protein